MRHFSIRAPATMLATLILLGASALGSTAAAQGTGTVRGRILEAESNAPLAAVQVTIVGTRLGAIANNAGVYLIRGVPTGPQTVRAVWQFFENSWVHPYILGGLSLEAERPHVWVPEQFFYGNGDPRNPSNRIPLTPSVSAGPATAYRVGAIAGIGSKFYMSPRSYFNTSVLMSQARTSRNVSFIAGFGWDF